MRSLDARGLSFRNSHFGSTDLRGVDFTDAYLQDVHGQPESLPKDYRLVTNTSGIQYIVGPKVNLQGADLRGCNLDSLSLSAAFLEETKLETATLNGSSFSCMTGKPESLPEGYHLIENQHKEPYLLGPQLDLRYADLVGVDFRGMNLSGVNFTGANLMYTKFRGANLAGATFNDAFVKDARFYQSNISGASFSFLKGKPASVPTGYSIRKEASKGSSPYPDFHIVTK